MRKIGFFLLILIAELSVKSYGQEVLLDLQTIPIKENKTKRVSAPSKSKSLLTLPFFDDFSRGDSYPTPENWSDSYVIINQTYAINPPTIGVATFDAINQKGELYENLSSSSAIMDTLTSQPINLDYSEKDSLYLSFQYQPKGLGEAPDPNDSLVVEFFSVDYSNWIRVWSASANFLDSTVKEKYILSKKIVTQKATSIASHFFNVMLPITSDRFRKEGFKFRFMNYASLPSNTQVPSIRGNGDHWHIDIVYLNKNRNSVDSLPNDVGFTKPLSSLLKDYQSIPWKHFSSEAKESELTNPLTLNIKYINLSPDKWDITRRFIITDLSNLNAPYPASGGSDPIFAYQTEEYIRDYEYDFLSNWEDSAKYCMESYLITNSPEKYLRWNDTIRFTQQFLNYYAYDDGSAENGYGIFGEGSDNGRVAIKYHSYLPDSLKQIMIYFNRSYNNANQQYFKLTVWKDLNGKPGDILYQKIGIKPIYRDSLNQFTYYSIDSPLKISGDFWIGWVNTTDDFLNVGFDLNNIHNDKLYYNLNGTWVESQFKGSLMIRPVFGKITHNPTVVEKPISQVDFTLYPNPASNQINLSIDENVKPETIRIINLAGQVVMSTVYESRSIDLGYLPTGVYLFQLTFQNKSTTTKKLVIIK